MDLTQLALGIQFIEFDIRDLFYFVKEFYVPPLVEEWFNEGVFICQPRSMSIMPLGPALTIEPWSLQEENKKRHSTTTEKYVLLQILQMMPLKLDGHDSAKLVLHELAVVAWNCLEDCSPLKPEERRYVLRRRPEAQVVLVLDRWVSHAVLHACRKKHEGLLFEASMYSLLLHYSGKLKDQVDEEVESGLNVQLGRTVQEMSWNQDQYHRARALINRVFDLVDIAYVVIRRESTEEKLKGARLLLTDELKDVKPPKPSPEDQE